MRRLFKIFTAVLFFVILWPIAHDLPAKDAHPSKGDPDAQGSMDFKSCVHLALEQSPYFTRSAIEIEIRLLDESDSRWSFVPTLNLTTGYSIAVGGQRDDNKEDYYISFTSDTYNPVKSYYSLKVHKLITRIAILRHQIVMREGIYSLARKLLEMHSLDRMEACQEEKAGLNRQKLTFVEERHTIGAATLLEVQLADQELALAKLKIERIATAKAAIQRDLKYFLRLNPVQRLDIDLGKARAEVLEFIPANATLDQAKSNFQELKIQEIKKQLQELHVTLAYTDYVPNFSFGVRTPTVSDVKDGDYFVNLGVSVPIWQGFKTSRDITRQKKILRQYENETELKEEELSTQWQTAQQDLREAEIELKLAHSAEELARLKERQSEIRYKSNSISFLSLLDHQMALLEEQKTVAEKILQHDLSVLQIRHLSGDLFNTYVNVASIEE